MDVHSNSKPELLISAADARPMYVQIVEQVRRLVAAGAWPAGHEIPSIRQLAIDLRVSVITVKRAYLELEREGVIVTQQGKGSSVAPGANLGPRLLEQDLDRALDEAARLAAQLGISKSDLQARLRDASVRQSTRKEER
jgi:GntR family transcriptional regulator